MWRWRCGSTIGLAGVCGAIVAVTLGPCAGDAAAAVSPPPSVGVVDFYAPTPLPVTAAVIPERTAADETVALLARSSPRGLAVVPRPIIARAEAALGWRRQDVLSFARLTELAHAVGARWLVVGWIPTLSIGGAGSERFVPNDNGMPLAQASVVVQVFDAVQGRIVAETTSSGSAIGIVPAILVRDVLRNALAPTVPWLLAHLAPSSIRAVPPCCQ